MRHTAEATVDGQGRISLPQHLVRLAGIEKEMTFVGAGAVIEIWNPDQYQQYVGGPDEDFESWMSSFL
jgi:MraZ protein